MINKLNIVLVFAALLLLDGLFLPGIFGFKEGVVASVFLLAMILNWGVITPVLWLGSGIALFLEFFWKLQPGVLMLMFLTVALIYFFIASLFSVKRYVGAVILSFALPSVVFGGGWGTFNGIISIVITAFASFALCFFIFDRVVEVRKSPANF